MFSGWGAYRPHLSDSPGPPSVLDKFPPETARQIAIAVVDSVVPACLDASRQPIITTEEDVDWTMNVVAHGLRLPLEYEETIRKCCLLYQDWMNVLLGLPSSAPRCIRNKPEFYAQRILSQFEGTFTLRSDSDGGRVAVHIRLALHVLGVIQRLAFGAKLSELTWNTLLSSLVKICDRLLSPPCRLFGTLAERIGEPLVQALYNVWIKACDGNFPSPTLWKTLQEAVVTWRHQRPVVDEWTQICQVLTSSVVRHLYGSSHGDDLTLKATYEDNTTTVSLKVSMPPDALVQCWYRFLLILGNPVELSRPQVIGKTQAFMQAAIENGDPDMHHTCLQRLPSIFLLAQRGVAGLVDLFLQLSVQPGQLSKASGGDDESQSSIAMSPTAAVTADNRLHDVAGTVASSFLPASLFSANKGKGADGRPALPKRSTLLHIFGEWLFQSALPSPDDVRIMNRIAAGSAVPASRVDEGVIPMAAFEAGRAEALACLCRLFCASCCNEQFIAVYLARFYYVLQQGLTYIPNYHRGDVLANLLMFSSEIFCNDLAGAFCLMPSYLDALELVLPVSAMPFVCNCNVQELRRSSTMILMSLLCVPMHFNDLTISDLSLVKGTAESSGAGHATRSDTGGVRFSSLRVTITNLVFAALRCEKSPPVVQMLLGAVMVMVQDAAAVEKASQPDGEVSGDPGDSQGSSLQSPVQPEQRFSLSAQGEGFQSRQQNTINAAVICVRACRDVTQRFLRFDSSNSVHVIMSALELMSGLATLNLCGVSGIEWRYTVRWLCDFINTLVCQPPRAHSRDLHSMIVAAYHCLLAWTTCNHRLLFEQEPLRAVLDVCELGLTGSKSVSKPRDEDDPVPSLRGEKEFRPVSRRVLEAAEMVLYAILEHLGAFPPPMGPAAVSSMLDEASLLKRLGKTKGSSDAAFRYYSIDSSTLLGLLPCPVTSDATLPTVTIILRGPSGRHTWTMQLRQVPRHAQPLLAEQLAPVKRPEPHSDPKYTVLPPRQPWPEVVKAMPKTEADCSIPALAETLGSSTEESVHVGVQDLVNKQAELEREFVNRIPNAKHSSHPPRLKPPPIREAFQTSRLLLSHLGFVTPEGLMSSMNKNSDRSDSFTLMDSEKSTFSPQVQALDALPTRHTDTVHVFYVRPGQSSLSDILSNRNLISQQRPEFAEFLNALGWPVDFATHPGFKGVSSCLHNPLDSSQAPMPYYADNNTEVLFVVPSLQKRARQFLTKLNEQRSVDGSNAEEATLAAKVDILDAEQSSAPTTASMTSCASLTSVPLNAPSSHHSRSSTVPLAWQLDASIIIVWLERFEDWAAFPLGKIAELVSPMQGGSGTLPIQAVFVHPLNTGLYRIERASSPSSGVMAGPLLNDMVVSRRSLGPLVRQTVLNMARRRRILADSYSPPHALRKRRMEELCKGHINKQSIPDFYCELFRPHAAASAV